MQTENVVCCTYRAQCAIDFYCRGNEVALSGSIKGQRVSCLCAMAGDATSDEGTYPVYFMSIDESGTFTLDKHSSDVLQAFVSDIKHPVHASADTSGEQEGDSRMITAMEALDAVQAFYAKPDAQRTKKDNEDRIEYLRALRCFENADYDKNPQAAMDAYDPLTIAVLSTFEGPFRVFMKSWQMYEEL